MPTVCDDCAISRGRHTSGEAANEQAFFVADIGDVVYKWKFWRLKLPRVEPYYTVKCNSTPAILKLLAGLGINFNCSTKQEIELINSYISPFEMQSRVIYGNPTKVKAALVRARDFGVDLVTFDSLDGLHKVKNSFPKARLVLKIAVGNPDSNINSGLGSGARSEDIEELLRTASELKLNVVGVAFHVGAGAEPDDYFEAISEARRVWDMAVQSGFQMNLLNIGGGFPGAKGFQMAFDRIARAVNNALAEFFSEANVRVLAEPGRYIVESAFTLHTTIIDKRLENDVTAYYINDSVYGSFANVLVDNYASKLIPLEASQNSGELVKSAIYGNTFDAFDTVCDEVNLPDMRVGSRLLFENLGAYTTSATALGARTAVKLVIASSTAIYLQWFSFWRSLVESLEEPLELNREFGCCATEAYCPHLVENAANLFISQSPPQTTGTSDGFF